MRLHAATVRAAASVPPPAAPPAPPAPANRLLAGAVEAAFRFPPVFRAAAAAARAKIVGRGAAMGLDFAAELAALRGAADWEALRLEVTDPGVAPPAYYRAPFHAYEGGNLSWDAALEAEVAARSVHAAVMDARSEALDPGGDAALRASFSAAAARLLACARARGVRDVLDVGCATGLSSRELLRAHPRAAVTGVDLSPHFLAVGTHLQRVRAAAAAAAGAPPERLRLVHAAAEATGLPGRSFDLVSVCLVLHELPEAAARAVFAEAARLLRPGGAIAIMEMDPSSPAFRRVLSNPFPYAIFKSTEPYLLEYVGMDLADALQGAGFAEPRAERNSPRHKTVVATLA